MNKYQEALYTLTDWFHSYTDAKGLVHEKHIDEYYQKSEETIQELIDKYNSMYEQSIEDAEFLEEVVEPQWEEIKKSSPVKILQSTDKEGNFVGNTVIEPDYEKALDKACDRLEMYCVDGIIQKMDLPYDLINVIPTKEKWKEWLLKDE